jgi:hypothetical protein
LLHRGGDALFLAAETSIAVAPRSVMIIEMPLNSLAFYNNSQAIEFVVRQANLPVDLASPHLHICTPSAAVR